VNPFPRPATSSEWGACGFLHPEPAASRERVSPNLPRAVNGRDGSGVWETRRRNLPRAVKRGPASRPIRREAKPSPPPSHKIFSGTGAFYSPINGRERGGEGLVACQTVLNEDMSSFQVCFQGLVMTMHPRKTTISSVAFVSHRSFQHFRSLREALPSPPDRRKHSRRERREVLLSEKRVREVYSTQTASPRRAGYPGEG
jgi:hypothetical protein